MFLHNWDSQLSRLTTFVFIFKTEELPLHFGLIPLNVQEAVLIKFTWLTF